MLYAIVFYVPEENLESVKDAMFAAGAGKWGAYERCAWQVKGRGQFMPLEGSSPHIGSTNKIEYLDEWRVEMICEATFLHEVIAAMKTAHPYETVAYTAVQSNNI
ncbi:MAG: NGG1p interacting factor NIF3 [Oligoflexia bacterium]|nr:NGG1p interacting factor NIF3 [Oligoflexia bacterium]